MFTPFYSAWSAAPRRAMRAAPRSLPPLPPRLDPGSVPPLAALGLCQQLEDPIPGGEHAGRKRMRQFISAAVAAYATERDMLDRDGVSRLSAYLHLGCLSARELEQLAESGEGPDTFRRQLCWRDFYANVLLQFPANARTEHQPRYRGKLAFSPSGELFNAWREGRTGYPLIDAAMCQLQHEGWIHNRARAWSRTAPTCTDIYPSCTQSPTSTSRNHGRCRPTSNGKPSA